jgi:hypothetical protein
MAQTLSVNANNDIYLDADGNISISYGVDAATQACAQAAKTRLGEVFLNANQGIPYEQTVWTGVPNTQQFTAALRAAFLNVPSVVEVLSLITSRNGNNLNYTAVIRTTFGGGAFSG